ncbi:MAG: type II toxin-antitoxin system PrlF family antitoxin [Pseudomonadota bacterium]|nr:type II toxin-antitoxin system PrlF family antitoxin [Pseudomonadota bacterium]
MHTDNDISRLTSKHQATVPRRIRQVLGLKGGDAVRFRVKGKQVVLEKASRRDKEYRDYLKSLDAMLAEWHSPEDDELFKDL